MSSPLVPAKDPTLLFTNAGMNQFKDVFLGKEKRDYSRAVSIQKCMRVSGKHNDFDEVGRTDYHHTFFEMLGNFSFGDYFKEKAIEFAWELLTQHYKFDKERLIVTVFKDDDEAYRLWEENIGVPTERIFRLGEKDNFWQMGETGPCGPCSEIHVDRGDKFGPPEFSDGNRRFVEVWNLVFMQYYRNDKGVLSALPSPSIDTGMGMERLTTLLSGVNSNYDTDLFKPIIEMVADMSGIDPEIGGNKVDFNVIADHVRALSFLISDGVLPSNDGRGYVLRRLLRRAARHGKALGFKGSFLYKISDKAVSIMNNAYPEMEYKRKFIAEVIKSEEERFHRTLSRGLKLFLDLLDSAIEKNLNTIPGKDIFKLSDTYGFPLDFSIDLAREKDINIDIDGFNMELAAQKEKSRAQLKARRGIIAGAEIFEKYNTVFSGYETLEEETKVVAIVVDSVEKDSLSEGEEGLVIFEKTPFYGESGGQVGDKGAGKGENCFFSISDVKKSSGGTTLHLLLVEKGILKRGDSIRVKVDAELRKNTAIHHTSTHLLQAALREVLGLHVKQSGSYVGPDKLRFDFTHFKPISRDELDEVEALINKKIRENIPVTIEENPYEDAIKKGAMAIFAEKYSDKVRVVTMDDFSMELCGGTHLNYTGEAGYFKIINESSIAAGIRRIEAVAGEACDSYLRNSEKILNSLEDQFKQKRENLPDFLLNLTRNIKENKKDKSRSKERSKIDIDNILDSGFISNNVSFFINFIKDGDISTLRSISDTIINRDGGLAVMCTNSNGKSRIVVSVSKNLTKKINASRLIKEISSSVRGSGGGRKDFAQAGGDRITDVGLFISETRNLIEKHLK